MRVFAFVFSFVFLTVRFGNLYETKGFKKWDSWCLCLRGRLEMIDSTNSKDDGFDYCMGKLMV